MFAIKFTSDESLEIPERFRDVFDDCPFLHSPMATGLSEVHEVMRQPIIGDFATFCSWVGYASRYSLNVPAILGHVEYLIWLLQLEEDRVSGAFYAHYEFEEHERAKLELAAENFNIHRIATWNRGMQDYAPGAFARATVPETSELMVKNMAPVDGELLETLLETLDLVEADAFVMRLLKALAYSPAHYRVVLNSPILRRMLLRGSIIPCDEKNKILQAVLRFAYLFEYREYLAARNASTVTGFSGEHAALRLGDFAGLAHDPDIKLANHPFMLSSVVGLRGNTFIHAYRSQSESSVATNGLNRVLEFSGNLLEPILDQMMLAVEHEGVTYNVASAITGSCIAASTIDTPRLYMVHGEQRGYEDADIDIAVQVPYRALTGAGHTSQTVIDADAKECALAVFDNVAQQHFDVIKRGAPGRIARKLTFKRVETANKHKFTIRGGPRTIEIYHVEDIAFTVRKFHVAAVRAWWGPNFNPSRIHEAPEELESSFWCYPSYLMAAYTRISPDIRWTSSNVDVRDVLIKYLLRGFGIILNTNDSETLLRHALIKYNAREITGRAQSYHQMLLLKMFNITRPRRGQNIHIGAMPTL